MKTYNLTLQEAVGEELAQEVQDVIGIEHAEELAEVEPAYNWVASGSQSHAILEAMIQALDIDRDY
jgi:hypothetical protein